MNSAIHVRDDSVTVIRGGLFLDHGNDAGIQIAFDATEVLIADNYIGPRPRWWQLRSWFRIVRWVFR